MASLPEPPIQLKAIQGYMKIAADIEKRDPIVTYWICLHSTETALKINRDSPESKAFLSEIIVWLEKFKQTHKDDERVTNQIVGQAHFENYVMNIFNTADTLDRSGEATRKVVAMFFMASMLFEIMAVFGTLTDEIQQRAKYAKFKAAYIQKCLKAGQTPKPGPIDNSDLDGVGSNNTNLDVGPASSANSQPSTGVSTNLGSVGSTISSTPQVSPYKPSPTSPLVLPETPDQDSKNSSYVNVSDSKNSPNISTIKTAKFSAINGTPLNIDDMVKAQKYCKYAASALQYEDITTAIANLEKTLRLLKTGENPD